MSSMSQRSRWSPAAAALLLAAACGEGGSPGAPASGGAVAPAASRAAVALDGSSCQFTAAHPKHASAACTTCHACVGVVEFTAGAAAYPGQPPPSYDAIARSCANAACHGVRPGTFSYGFPDGTGEPELVTFAYGSPPRPTPSWLAAGIGCAGCHDNPPRNATWHSGTHALQGPTGPANQCQFCHPDATGTNGAGTAITAPALHGNGIVEVQARFASRCFGCH